MSCNYYNVYDDGSYIPSYCTYDSSIERRRPGHCDRLTWKFVSAESSQDGAARYLHGINLCQVLDMVSGNHNHGVGWRLITYEMLREKVSLRIVGARIAILGVEAPPEEILRFRTILLSARF